jgi:2-polyprenyl-6-methoxyphenol hydroxylase-like FAD-dependent oxidoreductase
MADSPFLIVGGGIAGLAAGLGLARIGKSSHILEKSPTFDAMGAGLQLGPNAVHALQWLGAWDAVAPHCVAPAEIHVRDGISGNILQRIPLGAIFEKQFGAPYQVAHRADLQNGLLESVRSKTNIELQIHAEVTNVSTAETTLALKSGINLFGEAIIGADGVHSMIRNHLTGQIGYRPKGHALFRSLVPINSIPPSANTDVVTLWLYSGGHVVHYAVSNGQKFNVVAAVENSEASLNAAFHRACKPLADLINSKIQWSTWPARDIDPVQNWNQNRTVLIGDAAHASLPYLAQGAAMALEDACVLSGLLKNSNDIPLAFQEFFKQRYERTRAVQMKSRQLGNIYHAKGILRLIRNGVLKTTLLPSFTKQLEWIYAWKAD